MTDIALSPGEDALVAAGDFMATESTAQHQRQLLLNGKGDFRQNPTICAGAFTYLDDERLHDLVRVVSIEFTRDGMDVQSVQLAPDGTLASVAVYKG